MSVAPSLYVGTSGYSFADWVGPFYPPGTKSTDFLAFYARQFGCVEVNSTYYRIPNPAVISRMEQKTPEGFRFVVKLNQAMTHDGSTEAALYHEFLAAIQPLKDAGKYHGLLAQFPWAFRRTVESKAHLERLRALLPGEPLLTRDNLDSMSVDNVLDPAIRDLTAASLGIKLTPLEAVAPHYLAPNEPLDRLRTHAGR